eukprot:3184361-Rhodomonas_salina.1
MSTLLPRMSPQISRGISPAVYHALYHLLYHLRALLYHRSVPTSIAVPKLTVLSRYARRYSSSYNGGTGRVATMARAQGWLQMRGRKRGYKGYKGGARSVLAEILLGDVRSVEVEDEEELAVVKTRGQYCSSSKDDKLVRQQ